MVCLLIFFYIFGLYINKYVENQIYAAEKKYHEQLDSYLARYINADFSLAQMEYILVSYRVM